MLPNDPNVLLSYINMKLRDNDESLEDLCEDIDEDYTTIVEKLARAGYKYNEETRQFR